MLLENRKVECLAWSFLYGLTATNSWVSAAFEKAKCYASRFAKCSLGAYGAQISFAGAFGALPKSTPTARGAFGALSDAILAPTAPKSLK